MSISAISWLYLLAAGAFEIAMTTAFRYTDGLTRPLPTTAFFALGLVSFLLLNKSLAGIPLGTAYAVWTGLGAAGTAFIGIAFYNEPTTTARLALLTVLIGSIIGLKLASAD